MNSIHQYSGHHLNFYPREILGSKNPIHKIKRICIYEGHVHHPARGPYLPNIAKRVDMFNHLNQMRKMSHLPQWSIFTTPGEYLLRTLKQENPQDTLLVIPAGQSTNLDTVFQKEELCSIQDFLTEGGRAYLNCGSAYFASRIREYNDVCEESPEERTLIRKYSKLPLFEGVAQGPLCPYPGHRYKVGFFSDAVRVTNGERNCTIYLSGGGSFVLPPAKDSQQKIKVVARYPHEELIRLGIKNEERELSKWENAGILCQIGKGAALLTMFHPYYGAKDFDPATYEAMFPRSGTDWKRVRDKLSSLEERMNFVSGLISQLETAFDSI
jgi:glutamine amidotransferase-like uncharacterized protein